MDQEVDTSKKAGDRDRANITRHVDLRDLLERFEEIGELEVIEGSVPDAFERVSGCAFHPRCREAVAGRCDVGGRPLLLRVSDDGHQSACLLAHDKIDR